MIDIHPWQRGPRELLQFAITAYASPDEAGRRISFLLMDVCVETTLRTFLGLPVKISGSAKGYLDLKQYVNGKFHDLTKGIEAAAPGRIPDNELHHLRFYHNVRNRLITKAMGSQFPRSMFVDMALWQRSSLKSSLKLMAMQCFLARGSKLISHRCTLSMKCVENWNESLINSRMRLMR